METITKIKSYYKEYKDSEKFIDACFRLKEKGNTNDISIRRFIYYHFKNNFILYRNCDFNTLKKRFKIELRNSETQVLNYNYEDYVKSIKNASKYRMILMEYKLLEF